MEGLSRLEYRGYDSAGIAIETNDGIKINKKTGRLSNLAESLSQNPIDGFTAMGHTRWATHGRPSDINSHPHTDCTGRFAVIHNGIIDNYLGLREQLVKDGHHFVSETDTEVVPHLIESLYEGCLLTAMQKVAPMLRGSYVLLAMSQDEPGTIVAVRTDTPLIIGLGEGENYFASDIPAILPHTRRVIVVEDGEVVRLRQDEVLITSSAGETIEKTPMEVQWSVEAAEKGGYPHFMLKEIFEQPRAVRDTLSSRIDISTGEVMLPELGMSDEDIAALNRIYIVACGTSAYAGQVGKYLLERIAKIPVEVDIASEFRYRSPIIEKDSLVIVLSQSGETLDTLAALREAKRLGTKVLGITNVVGSSIARESDYVLHTWAGPEIAVASTKAFITQLAVLTLFGLHCAAVRGAMSPGEISALVKDLHALPLSLERILADKTIDDLARAYAPYDHSFFIGRGMDSVVSLEGSHKLKEIAYVFAESYPGGELKHGALALVTEKTPVVAVVTQPEVYEKTIGSIKEVKARDARVLAVVVEGDTIMRQIVDDVLYIPKTHPLLMGMMAIVPLQMFAYRIAVERGCDVDKPRNLAKSVTVE
jgi:glucosamine--fructose-6-phosphate aminotransferase (isomerizing)